MVRIVEKRFGRVGKRRGKLVSRPMTSAQGKRVQGVQVDAQSSTFGEDLLASFARSVDRARRENMLLFGNRDRVNDDET